MYKCLMTTLLFSSIISVMWNVLYMNESKLLFIISIRTSAEYINQLLEDRAKNMSLCFRFFTIHEPVCFHGVQNADSTVQASPVGKTKVHALTCLVVQGKMQDMMLRYTASTATVHGPFLCGYYKSYMTLYV